VELLGVARIGVGIAVVLRTLSMVCNGWVVRLRESEREGTRKGVLSISVAAAGLRRNWMVCLASSNLPH
jgi:hypothetical protein